MFPWMLMACLSAAPSSDLVFATAGEATPELRGLWVTRWGYKTEADVRRTIDEAASAHFNAVFFQVRGTFDALYASSLEPQSALLSGVFGQDPGWDPLALAVDLAHQRGLQLHAYINVFPLWRGSQPPSSVMPAHAYLQHPEWVLADKAGVPMALNEGYVFADPAHPQVRERIAAVARDISQRYDVDGIHLDYVRYPEAGVYRAPKHMPGLSNEPGYRAALQRGWVNETVGGVRQAVDVPVTAAVWGVHTNDFGWQGVLEGNASLYQDSVGFLEQGLVDANIPMIYWPVSATEGGRLDFRTMARWHVAHKAGRHVYTGITAEPDKMTPEQVMEAISVSREVGADGFVLFESTLGQALFDDLRAGLLKEPAPPPPLTWR